MSAKVEYFTGSDGKYYWHLKSDGNYEKIAFSSQGYDSLSDCKRGWSLVRSQAVQAEEIDLTGRTLIEALGKLFPPK